MMHSHTAQQEEKNQLALACENSLSSRLSLSTSCPLQHTFIETVEKKHYIPSPEEESSSSMQYSKGSLKRKLPELSRKNVRFHLPEVTVSQSNPYPLTPEIEEATWWSTKDTQKKAKIMSCLILKKLKARSSAEKAQPDTEKAKGSNSQEYVNWLGGVYTGLVSPLDQNMPLISAESPVRGLETYLVPGRLEAKRKVLHRFHLAQSKLPPNATAEQRSALLREVSRRLTEPARQMARLFAVGDAKNASYDV